ncbi:hypothetical protein D3C86_1876180 [compost metagenome]
MECCLLSVSTVDKALKSSILPFTYVNTSGAGASFAGATGTLDVTGGAGSAGSLSPLAGAIGITALEGPDAGPIPAPFIAFTVKV